MICKKPLVKKQGAFVRKAVYQRLERVINIKLSILICTIPERTNLLSGLLTDLNYQIQSLPVEYIYLGDNKRRSIGSKRNDLLSLAQGEWIRFVDDDDSIYDDDIKTVLRLIEEHPDKKVICFSGTQNEDKKPTLDFRFDRKYGINHRTHHNGKQVRGMIPNHLCVWKKDVALLEKFPDVNLSEDHRWAKAMLQHYTEQDQIITEDYLYHYEFNREVSECRR